MFTRPQYLITGLLVAAMLLSPACRRRSEDPLADGIAAVAKGDAKAAVTYLEQARTLCPDDPSVLANLGIAYWRRGKTETALQCLAKAAALVPSDPRPYEFIAAIHREQGRWTEAWNAIGRANLCRSNSPRILTAMAAIDIHRKGPDNAMVWLRQALAESPDYAPALYNAGIIARDWQRNTVKARDYLGQYIGRAGSDPRANAVKAWLEGKPAGTTPVPAAGTPAAVVPKSGPPTLPANTTTARNPRAAADHINRGLAAYQVRDWPKAIQHFTRAVEADDSMASAWYNLGLAHRAGGDNATARDIFLRALQLQPDLVNAQYMLALVLRDMDQPDAAISHLRQILLLQPDYADAHLAFGAIYYKTGQADLCRKHLMRYLELMPNGPAAGDARRMLNIKR